MRPLLLVAVLAACVCFAAPAKAPDAVTADPGHYKVQTDNADVRVLRVHYGPHEKSVMHLHPATVAVFLTDSNAQFTFPDGTKQPVTAKAGDVVYSPPQVHLPENLGDKPFEVIVIELKHGSSGAGGSKKK